MSSTLATRGAGIVGRRRRGDAIFRGVTLAAGLFVLGILAAIAIFLLIRALPAISQDKGNFFTTKIWDPDGSKVFGIAALAFGTVLSSLLALVIAVPIAIGVALFIVEYAPRRVANLLGYLVDMLAAVPSVVYGLWAVYFLLKEMVPLQRFLSVHLGWIPLFADPEGKASRYSQSVFAASIILAIMIVPIIAAVSRDVLAQVDPAQREAALALGATRWEMIRVAMLPPSRPGLTGGIMLGLGRALGETIAVALVIGATFDISWHILTPGGNSIAANIANRFAESGSLGRSALIASGLVLFAITLAVNLMARAIIYRGGAVDRSAAV
ncbi:MAG: phosphate ABC transporter permease subunit PstC [Actinomycetota bacterium]|nr:phosphate ABC transporter permease subunit PstC [Actinomycetota bacterium]